MPEANPEGLEHIVIAATWSSTFSRTRHEIG